MIAGALKDLLAKARADAISECADLAQTWAADAAEFSDSTSQIMKNICHNLSVALRNKIKEYENDHQSR